MPFDSEPSLGKAIAYSVGAVMVVVGMIFGINTMFLRAEPAWNDMRTDGIEHSYAFVSTKQDLLLQLAADNVKLDIAKIDASKRGDSQYCADLAAQQKAIIARMRREAAQIPPDKVPPSVRTMLE